MSTSTKFVTMFSHVTLFIRRSLEVRFLFEQTKK